MDTPARFPRVDPASHERRPRFLGGRFEPRNQRALDGVVPAPAPALLVFRNAAVWDGATDGVRQGATIVVRDGRFVSIDGESGAIPSGATIIDAAGTTMLPGLIDAHVHMLYDSGPDLVVRGPALIAEWLERTRHYPQGREPIVRRGQLKLKSGVTTMRILGDGYYSLAYRDDLAKWDVVGPRVLAAGLHVNGPHGYISGGVAARLDEPDRALAAVEIRSIAEIEPKLSAHIARGIDVVKIATTHGDMGFADARPDLPEAWVRRIVAVAHDRGLKVTAHSYGDDGDWAAIRGGVDGIEHLVNVPHELSERMVAEIADRGIYVCPTLSGSAYGVLRVLRSPQLLFEDDDLASNVDAVDRRNLYVIARLLRNPGIARLLLRQDHVMERWESWYRHTIANTQKLFEARVRLIFGTDAPFTFGNFFHSIMGEVRGLKEAGIPNEAILRMATSDAAAALGIADRLGRIAEGKVADLVLVDGNPLVDIEALAAVRLVVRDGRVVYSRPDSAGGS